MIFSFYESALIFFVYGFLGWGVEVAFVAITLNNVENRGFLNGPICPIYGVGMLGVLMTLTPLKGNIILLFFGGALITTAIELFGGWILDKTFHMRWWDYSNQKYNLNGYICPLFSLFWGICVTLVVKLLHPVIFTILMSVPKFIGWTFIVLFIGIFAADMTVTLIHLIGIKKSLGQLDTLAMQLEGVGDQIKDVVGNSAITAAEKAEEGMEVLSEKAKPAVEAFNEKAKPAMEAFSEKTKNRFSEISREDLEKAWSEYTEKFQHNSKHMLNKLPKLNKSGKSINIREYINSLGRK